MSTKETFALYGHTSEAKREKILKVYKVLMVTLLKKKNMIQLIYHSNGISKMDSNLIGGELYV